MKKIQAVFLLFIPVSFVFFSCGKKQETFNNKEYHIQFDELVHFVKNHPSLIKTNDARSGKYCVYTDAKVPYGIDYCMNVADLLPNPPKTIVVEGYGKTVSAGAKAAYVISLENPQNQIQAYEAIDVKKFIKKPGEWSAFKLVLPLKPQLLDPNNLIKIYGWNFGQDAVMFDDLSIRFE
ncbi:MAG: hypothetical protein ACK5JC_08235 [Bacteroidota bacterium]|jgi:hypothetical protein